MDFREGRVTRNEVRARELNERIQESYESHPVDAQTDILCECGIEDCDVFIRITKAEYEDVRADARKFIIERDHLVPDIEDVLFETDRFIVVAKREGAPAAVAIATDPRG
jgi:hypothetical protein